MSRTILPLSVGKRFGRCPRRHSTSHRGSAQPFWMAPVGRTSLFPKKRSPLSTLDYTAVIQALNDAVGLKAA